MARAVGSIPLAAVNSEQSERQQMKPWQIVILVGLIIAVPVVIVILAAVLVVVNVDTASKKERKAATEAQLQGLKYNIQQYEIRIGSLPESLESLRDGPSDEAMKAKWVAPIITEIPTDAWDKQFVYAVNGNTYEIRSGGLDGQLNTDDDILMKVSVE